MTGGKRASGIFYITDFLFKKGWKTKCERIKASLGREARWQPNFSKVRLQEFYRI